MWTQTYDPCGNLWLSALLATVPVVLLLGLLGGWHMRAHRAALVGLGVALGIAVTGFGMPSQLALMAALYGALFGLFPIGWIVLCAIFVYNVTVEAGQFDVLRRSIASLADDARVQVLLIAFSFGAFIEGAAGFGTPVAISAAMLIGLGFRPLQAAGLALIGNTAPVAFGALGTPLLTLAKVTDLPVDQLSMMVGRQLPFFSLLVPFWLVWTMSGWRGMLEVWPACLTAGASFAIMQFLVSNYLGPELVDVAGAVVSIAAVVLLLRWWKPRSTLRDAGWGAAIAGPEEKISEQHLEQPTPQQTARALLPWAVLCGLVMIWGVPSVRAFLDGQTLLQKEIPGLHLAVVRDQPVVPTPKPEEAVFRLNWLSATGTALLFTGILSGFMLGLDARRLVRVFWLTLRSTSLSLLTISAMLALGFTTRYSGMDTTMGLALASTGFLFPFFSPILGWLGVALTGSDTSSNVLFGNLQQVTAERIGMSPILAAASNSSGGVMGKMIDAQSIVVASVATGMHGQEGTILRYVFFHSIALVLLMALFVAAQAYWLTGMVP
jgi:lactate permease